MKRRQPQFSWYDYQIDPYNVPKAYPGVYLLRDTQSGRSYVGASSNVARRLQRHELRDRTLYACPLYYSITDDLHDLPRIEASLAEAYDTFNSGLNKNRLFSRAAITSRTNAGSWRQNPEKEEARRLKFLTSVRNDEYRRKRSVAYASQNREDINAKISATNRATMSTPEFKAKRSRISKAIHTDEMRARKSASVKKAFARPEFKAKISALLTGRRLITNGTVRKWLHKGMELPSGFKFVS